MSWLTGWTYRKEITVTNANADFSSFILVGKTSDAVGEEVDCNGHCLDNFYDLRFTELDGTTLISHWRESVIDSGGTKLASIAFKNNSDPETTLFMYYGKADAPDVSSIADTFMQGDDFEWGNDEDDIDTSGGSITWTKSVAGSSTAKIDTAQKYGGTRSLRLYRDGTNSLYADFAHVAGTDYSIRFRLRTDGDARINLLHGTATKSLVYRADHNENVEYYSGAAYVDTGSNVAVDTWELWEVNNHVWGVSHDYWFNGVKIVDDGATNYAYGGYENRVRFFINDGTATVWIDNVIVCKWAATEPSFAFGSEETEAEQTKYPGTIGTQSINPEDDNDWVNPSNIGADDAAYASVVAPQFDTGDITYRLKAQNFGFTIPTGTIDGIKVEIERYNDAGETGKDYRVQLLDADGNLVGDNKAAVGDWETTPTIKSYGGATDKWSASPTVAMVNDADFGVVLSAEATADNADIYVDFIRITIYYSEGGVTHEGSATLAGAGTLANIGSLIKKGISALQGAATVAIIASLILTSAAPLGGEGTLTTEAHIIRTDSAALSGEGTLATEAHLTTAGAATLSGVGSLATIGSVITLYEYYNTGDTASWDIYGSWWRAQTFTPDTAHKITKVKLKLAKLGTPTGDFTVSIRDVDGEGKPTGDDRCSGLISATSISGAAFYEITLGSGYNLSASTKYAIVVRLSGGDISNRINWYCKPTGGYDGGNALASANSGSSWANQAWDFMFEEWGTFLPWLYGAASLEGAGSVTTIANLTLTATITSSGEGQLTTIPTLFYAGAASISGEGQLVIVATLFRPGSATLSGQGQVAAIAHLTKTDAVTISGQGQLNIVACLIAIGNTSLAGEGQLTVIGEIVGAAVEGEAVLSGAGTVESIACLITTGVIALQGEGLLSSIGSNLLCASVEAQGEGSLQSAAVCIFVGVIETTGEGSLTATAIIPLYGEAILTGEGSLSVISLLEIELALPYTVELRDGSSNLMAILHNASGISYVQLVNSPHLLSFTLPGDDGKLSHLVKANEIWVRRSDTGVLLKRFLLNKRRDERR